MKKKSRVSHRRRRGQPSAKQRLNFTPPPGLGEHDQNFSKKSLNGENNSRNSRQQIQNVICQEQENKNGEDMKISSALPITPPRENLNPYARPFYPRGYFHNEHHPDQPKFPSPPYSPNEVTPPYSPPLHTPEHLNEEPQYILNKEPPYIQNEEFPYNSYEARLYLPPNEGTHYTPEKQPPYILNEMSIPKGALSNPPHKEASSISKEASFNPSHKKRSYIPKEVPPYQLNEAAPFTLNKVSPSRRNITSSDTVPARTNKVPTSTTNEALSFRTEGEPPFRFNFDSADEEQWILLRARFSQSLADYYRLLNIKDEYYRCGYCDLHVTHKDILREHIRAHFYEFALDSDGACHSASEIPVVYYEVDKCNGEVVYKKCSMNTEPVPPNLRNVYYTNCGRNFFFHDRKA